MSASNNILLLTGTPGIGKTTVIKKVIKKLPSGLSVQGFYTEEIRVDNVRQGFELITLPGKRLLMAHTEILSDFRVGRYGVDVSAVEKAVQLTLNLDSNPDIFIIDEIGRMECFSKIFVTRMESILKSGKIVIATVALKGKGFISEVKRCEGSQLWEITRKNRDQLSEKVTEWIRDRVPGEYI